MSDTDDSLKGLWKDLRENGNSETAAMPHREWSHPGAHASRYQQQQEFPSTHDNPRGFHPEAMNYQNGHSQSNPMHNMDPQGIHNMMMHDQMGGAWQRTHESNNNMYPHNTYEINAPMDPTTNHSPTQSVNLQQVTPTDQSYTTKESGQMDATSSRNGEEDDLTPVPFQQDPLQQISPPNPASSAQYPQHENVSAQPQQHHQQQATLDNQEEIMPPIPEKSHNDKKRPAESQVIDLLDSDEEDDNAEELGSAANVSQHAAAAEETAKRQNTQAFQAYQKRVNNMPQWMQGHKRPAIPPTTIIPGASLGIPQNIFSAASTLQQDLQAIVHRNTPENYLPVYVDVGDNFAPTWYNLMPPDPPAPPRKPSGDNTAKKLFQLSLLNCREFTIEGLPVSWSGPPTKVGGLRKVIKTISREHGGNATYDKENDRWRIPLEAYEAFVGYLADDKLISLNKIPRTHLTMATLERERQQKGYPPAEKIISSGVPLGLAKALAPFQRGGVDFIVHKKGRGLIADDMGLGKTIQGIAAMSVYMDEWPVLVLSPSSARYHWESEFHRFLGVDSQVNIDAKTPEDKLLRKSQVRVLSNSKSEVLRPEDDTKVVICSYGLAPGLATSGLINPGDFKCAIVDESHMLKNSKTKRTKSLTPILKETNRLVLLSGTPALARPAELWPQLNLLNIKEYKWEDDESTFIDKYVKRGTARTRAELHALLTSTIMIRRLKNDILKSMKPKIRQKTELHVINEPGIQQEFRRLLMQLRQGKGELAKLAQNERGASIHGADEAEEIPTMPTVQSGDEPNERKAVLSRLYGLTGDVKLPFIAKMLNLWLNDPTKGKLCIFAHHIKVLDELAKLANLSNDSQGDRKYIRIDGKTSPRLRQDHINTFQNDASVRIALLGITAAGVGVTLTAASTVWFAELFWTPAIMIQAEDRCHRIGQQGQVKCNYFVARGTLDDVLWRLIEQKFSNLGEFVEGKEKEKLVIDKVYGEKDYQSTFESKESLANAMEEDIDENDEEANVKDLEESNLENDILLFAAEEQNELKNLDSEDDENEPDTSSSQIGSQGNGSVKREGSTEETVILLSDDEEEVSPESEEFNIFKHKLNGCRLYEVRFPGNPLNLDIDVINTRLVVVGLRPERVRLFGKNSKPNVGDVLVKINGQLLLPINDRRQFLMAQQYIRDMLNRVERVPFLFAEHTAFETHFSKKLEAAEPEVIEID